MSEHSQSKVILEKHFSMQRIVHFDFIGAPPNKTYFFRVLCAIKSWGATGIIIEWEDTFPFNSKLVSIGSEAQRVLSDRMYSIDDVTAIIAQCETLGLEVIQLVQTVGCLEYVLKHQQYSHLRENSECLADICLCKPEAKILIKEMIMQVLAVHKCARFFHIGGDAHCFGICSDCVKKVTKSPEDNWHLYLQHIKDIAMFIKTQCPTATVLIWDGVIRGIDPTILKDYNLGEIIQPVVCNFASKKDFHIDDTVWSSYKDLFPAVWTGSAYKGANGACTMDCDALYYLSHQEAWLNEMAKHPEITFAGNILLGKSRYEHFATFCELLPVSMESLAICLKSLTGVMHVKDLYRYSLPEWEWPGYKLADAVNKLKALREFMRSVIKEEAQGYMNPWHLQKGFVNRRKLENILYNINWCRMTLNEIEMKICLELHNFTGQRSATEWRETNITSLNLEMDSTEKTARIAIAQCPDQ